MKYLQWQTFNGGNWNTLEINVRNFVGRRGDLIMYTGTWVGSIVKYCMMQFVVK
jgi:hypothetical protein